MKDFCDKQLQVFCQDLTDWQKVVFIKVASKSLAQVSVQKPVKLKKTLQCSVGYFPHYQIANNVAKKKVFVKQNRKIPVQQIKPSCNICT